MPAASGTATRLHSLASKALPFTPAQPHTLISVCACTAALLEPLSCCTLGMGSTLILAFPVQPQVIYQLGRQVTPASFTVAVP